MTTKEELIQQLNTKLEAAIQQKKEEFAASVFVSKEPETEEESSED